ncbi:MAG TPA: SpoIIE family protein phosphatase [Bacteroidota bacterium]|nr:SpoIIE family protein phosphatase [Bacteroidota bacterium]
MPNLITRLKKFVLLVVASALLILVFIADVVRQSVDFDIGWVNLLRGVFVLCAFLIITFVVESLWQREQAPTKKLGFALVISLVVVIGSSLLFFISPSGFDSKNYALIPLGFDEVVWSNIYGVVLGTTMIVVLLTLRDILFSKRKKGTGRNFGIFLGLALATAVSTMASRPLESSVVTSILLVLTILAMVMNSFRLSWIVYLSKREKVLSIIYGFLLFGIFIGFDIMISRNTEVGKVLLYYSTPLQSFISSVSLFATMYFGMTFISTLFHLPTAEAFDRKISEVSSLHNLSKLVTQVFDFNELVDSVTTMTLEVCEANTSWLEIIHYSQNSSGQRSLLGTPASRPEETIQIAAMKNITREDTDLIADTEHSPLRDLVLTSRKPVVIDNVKADRRTQYITGVKTKINSMAIVPLVSHDAVIGILFATKDVEYGFDRDDVEVISAFADQATIAIENSRLIEKSLERERLMREMMLAQDMQKKLLPQQVPSLPQVELEALSSPAFEVGGDYYDFIMLDERHLGILVGDVSGKGVSAAFYMAEMKGIFQSLARIYREPKSFLSRAHETLSATIDKRSFISLIYAVIDLQTGVMTIARAGHCPMLFVSGNHVEYIKPTGLGLGIGKKEFFEKTITQEDRQLKSGDIAVFYTDGVTEAHPKDGPEFGYERLQEVVASLGKPSAVDVRDAIIMAVDEHMQHEPPEDDLTIVVMKWIRKD